jgi:hypothetical protein
MYYNTENITLSSVVEHCGAKISKLEITNNSKSSKPEGVEIFLFKTGCFVFS